MGNAFEYLETVTVYATRGFAYTEHKELAASAGRGMYRVARVTSGTDTTSAVQQLANTFMRVRGNGSFDWQNLDAMRAFSERVMGRANYSLAKVQRAWGMLAKHEQHAQFCLRQHQHWPYRHDVYGSKRVTKPSTVYRPGAGRWRESRRTRESEDSE